MRTVRRVKIDNRDERQIITGMIVSTEFLKRVRPILQLPLLSSPQAKTLAKWCLDYYARYERAPGRHVQDLFSAHKRKGMPSEQAGVISDFLESISGEYRRGKRLNVTYLLDRAEERFKTRSLEVLKEDIEGHLVDGNVQEAEAALGRYRKVSQTKVDGVNPFTDKEAILEAFDTDIEPLFTLPGELGRMVNQELIRGNFIGIMAPEKRGKSFWAQELAFRAYKAKCNVAHFVVGDMSRKQMMRRIHVRLTGRSYNPRHCGRLLIPILDCRRNQEDTCHAKLRGNRPGLGDARSPKEAPKNYRACTRCLGKRLSRFRGAVWYELRDRVRPLSWGEAYKTGLKFSSRIGGKKNYILIVTSSLTVASMQTQLDIWKDRDGFIPDVIIVDYADVMDAEPGSLQKDERHQQNERWRKMRALSLERNALLITFTQTDADSYDRDLIGSSNFSEDKRKYGHVTGMAALNQTDDEKAKGILRFGWIFLRESDYDRRRTAKVLECRQIGKVMIAAYR